MDESMRGLVDAALLLAVEGDDGETLSGNLVGELMAAMQPYVAVSTGSGNQPMLAVLAPASLVLLPPAQSTLVKACHSLVWQSESRDARMDVDDDGWWFDRSAVDALRGALEPFGLASLEAKRRAESGQTVPTVTA